MTTPPPSNSERSGSVLPGPHSAEKLVRDYVAFVLRVKNDFDAGVDGARDPLTSIEAEARRMGNIVLGRHPSYGRQPWQNASKLGAQMKVLLPNETIHYGDPGCALFMWLANQALNATAALNEGSAEESVRARLDAVIDDVVARIVGAR
jgi:hypothetical protein